MMKNIFIPVVLVLLLYSSCKGQQDKNSKESQTVKQQPMIFDLEIDDLSLINLSKDTNMLSLQLAMPSGDITMFYFRVIPKSRMSSNLHIRALFTELKQAENKSSSIAHFDSLKTVNYHSYAFEINKVEWDSIKNKANEIELTADTSYKNFYCEFCPHYTLVYNYKMIEDKLTKDKKVEKLFTYLITRYRKKLYASKK